MKKFFTSEAVSEGHPDKLCDQISDAILDACLTQDPYSRVACEVFVTDNYMVIGGEITTKAVVDYEKTARKILKKVGYDDEEFGVHWKTMHIDVKINTQSPDIAMGVDGAEMGAGDQGIMFGYANSETKEYMPFAITIANDLMHLASKLRKNGAFKWAKPDMKSQVTLNYSKAHEPKIDTILMSVQHHPAYNQEEFKKFIKEEIMDVVATRHHLNTDFKVLINPTGKFTIGGPKGDTGLTGRKIIADTYGGYGHHGGGAFSGKDATKVDRSAAYYARYAAKNIVAAGLADTIEIQLSYAIGKAKPISIYFDTFHTNHVADELIMNALENEFDFSVSHMLNALELRKPVFLKTATYGHFGKDHLRWEETDKVEQLKLYLDKKLSSPSNY
ncbi:methionine adenosyltransferase [Williamsoniiplasma lucivorax]|uniref:S-adenosylmethionine synthase n=1 Tax=Williamsoniiplasma lucivorax TaxID=209274 RepID=A0A2S5RDI2_9MOLU|nr:methionine adenosyltransferase [Williamsoniiplasma lucivorax]PPE05376.1 S-adenosylmethionine synthetase [Williamsoniiplasma lucivorax]